MSNEFDFMPEQTRSEILLDRNLKLIVTKTKQKSSFIKVYCEIID
jgi:hypothetical protein